MRLFLGLAGLDLRLVGGQDVPLGAARGERVRRDDVDILADQVVPGLDVLGVARSDGQHHDAVVDDALVAFSSQSAATMPGSTSRSTSGQRAKRDDVGRQAGLDRAALVAGGAVRLLEGDALPAAVAWNSGMSSSYASRGVE